MDSVTAWSDALYGALNGLSGRSWLFDTLVALAVDNNLVKAAPICAAFAFAWYRGGEAGLMRRRRILIVTLGAVFLTLAASKSIGDRIFLPRPYIHSQELYLLDGDQLVKAPPLAYAQPTAGYSHGRFERLREGEVDDNDLKSYPSDHAAFFFALALGIALASRAAGAVALGWTLIVICGSRIVTGTHSPLDIAAGVALGGAVLLAMQGLAARWGKWALEPAAGWTLRRPALASMLLFLILFETANSHDNIRPLLRTGKGIAERVIGA